MIKNPAEHKAAGNSVKPHYSCKLNVLHAVYREMPPSLYS